MSHPKRTHWEKRTPEENAGTKTTGKKEPVEKTLGQKEPVEKETMEPRALRALNKTGHRGPETNRTGDRAPVLNSSPASWLKYNATQHIGKLTQYPRMPVRHALSVAPRLPPLLTSPRAANGEGSALPRAASGTMELEFPHCLLALRRNHAGYVRPNTFPAPRASGVSHRP